MNIERKDLKQLIKYFKSREKVFKKYHKTDKVYRNYFRGRLDEIYLITKHLQRFLKENTHTGF